MPEEKLPQCCARKKNAIRMEQGDVAVAARQLIRHPESPRLRADLEKVKASKARAVASFEEHIHDESLVHG